MGEEQVTVRLTDAEKELLMKPAEGPGGFQDLIRSMQERITDHELVLTKTDIEKTVRYTTTYGSGGFQDRLWYVLRAIVRSMFSVG